MIEAELKQRQYAEINKALSQALETEAKLERLEKCGGDCQARRERLQHYQALLANWKRTYFPELP